MEGTNAAIYLLKCFLLGDFLECYCPKIARLILSSSSSSSKPSSIVPADAEEVVNEVVDVTVPRDEGDQALTRDDVEAVEERIGMVGWWSTAGGEDRPREEEEEEEVQWMNELLEEKEASTEELREAFYVFDRNEDGYISPEELWSVMRRLGFKEGMRMEDCQRMICTFDEDGDGRISFMEFKKLLENAL